MSSIGLFGSVVRDDFTPSSDIDIVVEFDRPIGIGFVHLGDYPEEKLNKKVDLVSPGGIKPRYWEVIKPQLQYI